MKGEDHKIALNRELEEEIANLPEDLQFDYLSKMHVIYLNNLKGNYRELFKDIYTCQLPQDFKLDVLEGDGAKWFKFNSIINLKMIPGVQEAIGLLHEKTNK